MSEITMHPERHLDPHVCFCPSCGRDTNELSLGRIKVLCDADGIPKEYADWGVPFKTPKNPDDTIRDVEENEHVPGSLCAECKESEETQRKIVEEGGVYFRCKECGMRGAIRSNAFSAQIRRTLGVEAPGLCGASFETCRVHVDMGIKHE